MSGMVPTLLQHPGQQNQSEATAGGHNWMLDSVEWKLYFQWTHGLGQEALQG